MATIDYNTGSYPLTTGKPAYEDVPPPDRLTTRHWHLYFVAVGLALLAVIVALIYGLVTDDARRMLRVMLTIAIATLGVGALDALIGALKIRANGRQLQTLKCSLKRHADEKTAERVAAFDKLADDLRTRVDVQGRAYTAVLEQACLDVGARMDGVRELVGLRLAELEQRIDQVEKAGNGVDLEAMAKRYVDLTRTFADRLTAIQGDVAAMHERVASAEEAMVTIACSTMGPARSTENGNGQRSGLDAEVIELARRISNKIGNS